MSTSIERSAILRYSARQMFDLVNDIEAYPQYMQGCIGAKVLSCSSTQIEASLVLGHGPLRCEFATRNRLLPPERIELELISGPFKYLGGHWWFRSLGQDACEVGLQLRFAFRQPLLFLATERWFKKVADQMVDNVCQRAQSVYPRAD